MQTYIDQSALTICAKIRGRELTVKIDLVPGEEIDYPYKCENCEKQQNYGIVFKSSIVEIIADSWESIGLESKLGESVQRRMKKLKLDEKKLCKACMVLAVEEVYEVFA